MCLPTRVTTTLRGGSVYVLAQWSSYFLSSVLLLMQPILLLPRCSVDLQGTLLHFAPPCSVPPLLLLNCLNRQSIGSSPLS